MRVIIDGEAVDPRSATISVFDWAVLRGFGAFEVMSTHGGRPFRLDRHLDRLEHSIDALDMHPFDRERVNEWIEAVAEDNDDGLVRVLITGGGRDTATERVEAPPRVVVVWEPLPPLPERLSVLPMRSPWHPATAESRFSGVKWLSYAPNMASTDVARAEGFDDAVLLTVDDVVLEGPTWSVAWITDGRLYTPALDLGILYSITREALLECAARLGIEVAEGRFPVSELLTAEEALAASTGKAVTAIGRVGDVDIPGGPTTAKLAAAFWELVATETGVDE